MNTPYVDFKVKEIEREALESMNSQMLGRPLGRIHDDQTKVLESIEPEERLKISTEMIFNTYTELEKLGNTIYKLLKVSGLNAIGLSKINEILGAYGARNVADLERQIATLKHYLDIVGEA